MIIGKANIRPTKHYWLYHSDVEWDLVVLTVISPTKTRVNEVRGKNRFGCIKKFKKFVIKVHAERDEINNIVWVINAFKMSW